MPVIPPGGKSERYDLERLKKRAKTCANMWKYKRGTGRFTCPAGARGGGLFKTTLRLLNTLSN